MDKEERGRRASVEGFAYEHIAAGILMKKYQNVSLVDLPLSPYDLIIVLKDQHGKENIIRAQVKKAKDTIRFTGGTRGGIDREYKSNIKTYIQSTKTSDVIIGVHPLDENSFELYFFPTVIVEQLNQKSISLSRVSFLKNNYFFLENCKNYRLVIDEIQKYGLIR